MLYHVAYLVLLDLSSRDRGDGLADPGKEQFEELIDLGASAHGGSRVMRAYLLFNGDGR